MAYFGGILFSREDEIHEHTGEHIQASLLLGGRTNGNLVCYFHSSLQLLKGGFQQKVPHIDVRNGRLKPGKLMNQIGHIGNKTRQFSIIALMFTEQHFSKHRAFLLQSDLKI